MLFWDSLTLVGVKRLISIGWAIFDVMPRDFTSVANIARWKWDIGSHWWLHMSTMALATRRTMRLTRLASSIVIWTAIGRLSLLLLSLLTHLFDILTCRFLVLTHKHLNHVHRRLIWSDLVTLPQLLASQMKSRRRLSHPNITLALGLLGHWCRRWHRWWHLI